MENLAGSPWANLPQTVKCYEETQQQQIISGLHSNNVVVIKNSKDSLFVVKPNQRLHQIVMLNCVNCRLWVLDSAVIVTQKTVVIDCDQCQFLFEDVDMRHIECHGVKNSEVVIIDSLPLIEFSRVYWLQGSSNNKFTLGAIIPGMVFGMSYKPIKTIPIPDVPDDSPARVSSVDDILIRKFPKRGETNTCVLNKQQQLDLIAGWESTRLNLTPDQLAQAYDDERKEYEEPDEGLVAKVKELAAILKTKGHHVVCYTGAGISTSADIPDYRGPQGVWTLKEKGKKNLKSLNFDDVMPTYAHYAITELVKLGLIHYVISTNMDALHLRSGLPPHLISEQHGNSNKEVCTKCSSVYYRQYDTHEGYPDHLSGRSCTFCHKGKLADTIVNFGENLHDSDQMNSLWHSRKSTVALVMGTSMNVQPAASYPLQVLKNEGKLAIVNLQRTPFDSEAHVRIFAKTDNFMRLLLAALGIDRNLRTDFDAKNQWSDDMD